VFDVCAPVEVNSLGALTTNGGYWLPGTAQYSGTATAGTTTTLTDSGQSWTTNALVGMYVYLIGGTGSGQAAGYIVSNTATQITIRQAWATAPDATSVYKVVSPSYTTDGIHPALNGHVAIASVLTSWVNSLVPLTRIPETHRVNFGVSGLSVSYTVLDTSGKIVIPQTTAGVNETANGVYSAAIPISSAPGNRYIIVWNDGRQPAKTVLERVNP
jgi:hypothetical protein